MAGSVDSPRRTTEWLTRRLLEIPTVEAAGPEVMEDRPEQHPWWQDVCLTGADYFSTLGYMPRRYTEVVVRSSATQREATRPSGGPAQGVGLLPRSLPDPPGPSSLPPRAKGGRLSARLRQ